MYTIKSREEIATKMLFDSSREALTVRHIKIFNVIKNDVPKPISLLRRGNGIKFRSNIKRVSVL